MSNYDTAQICLNGHLLTESVEEYPSEQSYCSKCGSKSITKCPNCNAQLHGYGRYLGIIKPTEVTAYCYNCGKPYPWTESALESANLIIQEAENFSVEDKAALVESLPDIVSETPRTNLAIARTQRFLKAVGGLTADMIRQFVIDFGCELAKKQIGI
jgi:hypothetical protein